VSTTDQNSTPQTDPEQLARAYAEIARASGELLSSFIARQQPAPAYRDELGISKAFFDLTAKMMADPARLAQEQLALWQDYQALWQSTWLRMMGAETAPVAEPVKGDRRFKDDDWQQNFLFDFIKQSYLITARHLHHAVVGVEGLDQHTAEKVDFYTRQYIDAMSPSNFALTNPKVLRETAKSGGQNLIRGFSHLLHDLARGDGRQLRISMTDETAFRLGENIATTPGRVVFQNDLLQLIQYLPRTEKVHQRPLLIIPPWINKYYILDLREKNSFIRWAVEQGHTVFVVSWVNPDAQLANKGFDDYLTGGSLAALDAVTKATGEREIDVIGYCLGGTLLAATLGYLAAKKRKRIASATFFVTLIDFERAGELGVFIDDEQVTALEKRMDQRGYLEGREMATTFNMLRANDLIWSFVVSNYLLGRDPLPFDLLYWNADSTRMPAAMHSFYLRNMYLANLLRKPGGITLAGVPIDLSKVEVPTYFISTIEDHIAPWKATYAGARLFKGPVRFVLGGSGHIAGIVNPPAANKYGYWTHDKLPAQPDQWLKAATQHPGSWWTDWAQWVARRAGKKIAARMPGDGKLKIIEDAPGSYVNVKSDDGAAQQPPACAPGAKART
jgi:polyhydroxyalkanoate synthase